MSKAKEVVAKIDKSEAMGKVNRRGLTKEDQDTQDEIKWKDQATLRGAANKNPLISKKALNNLKMSSHRMGTFKQDKKVRVTDNIDDPNDSYRNLVITTTGKQVIGFKELDFLRKDEEIEWVVMSEIDYSTQLIFGLLKSKLPKKVIISGRKAFLDPLVFIGLVKAQKEENNVDLTVSFDRGAGRGKGNLTVIVMNPRNYDHYRPDRKLDTDDEWTRRFRSDGSVSNKKGI